MTCQLLIREMVFFLFCFFAIPIKIANPVYRVWMAGSAQYNGQVCRDGHLDSTEE